MYKYVGIISNLILFLGYSVKRNVISSAFEEVKKNSKYLNTYYFNNQLIKQLSGSKFSNQFDATKFDSKKLLPDKVKNEGFFIVHLGKGKHAFVKGEGYHKFESIPTKRDWKPSYNVISKLGESEASTSSELFNYKIIHDFLGLSDKSDLFVHTARRTRVTYDFIVDPDIHLKAISLQIEIDAFFETLNEIITVEVKNGDREDFEIRQLFSAMKYMESKIKSGGIPEKYVIRHLFVVRQKVNDGYIFRIYEYVFTDKDRLNSIKLIKSVEYLVHFHDILS